MKLIYGISSLFLIGFLGFNISENMETATNVLGSKLASCCTDPMTGYYRDGFCNTGMDDRGSHVVCAIMTQEFLDFTKAQGNDLCTPIPAYRFPGLKAGDKWCLCALRWREALQAGAAPSVVLEATHQKALQYIHLEDLKAHAVPSKSD